MIKKENLPSKICLICERPFTWRKNGKRFAMKLSIVAKNVEEIGSKQNENK